MKQSASKDRKNKENRIQGGGAPRPVVMVCLSPSPSNKRVIRAAARMAFSGLSAPETGSSPSGGQNLSESRRPPLALFVGTTGKEQGEESLLTENILYARERGFEIHTVIGDDIPLSIAEFARLAGVTDLFLGYSPSSFFFQTRRPINEKLLYYLPAVDIHIIPDPASDAYPGTIRKSRNSPVWDPRDLLSVLAVMAAATFLSFAFYHSRFSNSNIVTIYILAVLVASVMTSSRLYGLLAAVLYILLFNFLFIEPRFTLLVYDSTYLVTYLVTMVAALITGTVTIRMKNIARVSAENAYQAKILLDTSNQLEQASGREEIIRTTSRQLVHLLNRAVLFVPVSRTAAGDFAVSSLPPFLFPAGETQGQDQGSPAPDAPLVFPAGDRTIPPSVLAREAGAIRWSAQNLHQAGAFTSHYPECSCRYLSVYSGENPFGVIGIAMGGRPFSDFENTILLSIVHEFTMALENERMGQEQKKAEILAENERLRAGLLRSISHDLRTPLTSIRGNASNLLSHEEDLPAEDRKKIYEDIMEDAEWLNGQFENILSMTRLESGRGLQLTVESMEDVIEESLKHLAPHPVHEILFDRTDQALFAPMDPKLIMQVLVNLLNNAIKYTPAGSVIHIRMFPQKDMVCVEVADNGPGIPDRDKPHIFELFYTGTHPLSDSYRSMGIGLNLCYLILRAHGGDISVRDSLPGPEEEEKTPGPGRGAVFCFSLPAARFSLPE